MLDRLDERSLRKLGCGDCGEPVLFVKPTLKKYKRKWILENVEIICRDCKRKRKSESFDRDGWIIKQLRRLFFLYPPVQERARVAAGQCEMCRKYVGRQNVHRHHRIPVHTGATLFEKIDLLFCDPSDIMILCKACHKEEHK